MFCKVIKSFPLSIDGITASQTIAGSTVDVPADLVPGLVDGGFIEAPENKADQDLIETGGVVAAVGLVRTDLDETGALKTSVLHERAVLTHELPAKLVGPGEGNVTGALVAPTPASTPIDVANDKDATTESLRQAYTDKTGNTPDAKWKDADLRKQILA